MAMDPEKRKDLIKTILLATFFIALALVMLDQFMGDPMKGPSSLD